MDIPDLPRGQLFAFQTLAWIGVTVGVLGTVLGVAAAVQSGKMGPLIVSLFAAGIGWSSWRNIKRVRAARPSR